MSCDPPVAGATRFLPKFPEHLRKAVPGKVSVSCPNHLVSGYRQRAIGNGGYNGLLSDTSYRRRNRVWGLSRGVGESLALHWRSSLPSGFAGLVH